MRARLPGGLSRAFRAENFRGSLCNPKSGDESALSALNRYFAAANAPQYRLFFLWDVSISNQCNGNSEAKYRFACCEKFPVWG